MSTTPSFTINKLTVDSVSELNREDTLYLVDFRATGESLSHEIYSMFMYENLTQWLCARGGPHNSYYVMNSADTQRLDINDKIMIAQPALKPSTCVIDRIEQIPAGVSGIWCGIPHPSIDKYTSSVGLKCNYSYTDFLHFNNKLKQKILLGDLSPDFFEIHSQADLDKAVDMGDGYIKSSIGAGGFSVLDIASQSDKIRKKADIILNGKNTWYYEERATGIPQSIQIYKNSVRYTLFGYAEQYIEGTNYVGARLLEINEMSPKLVSSIQIACKRIDSLLSNYDGFLGIDIMVDGSKLSVLELNVRLTATTIPTLLANSTGAHEKVEYFEEVTEGGMLEDDIILSQSPDDGDRCILRFHDQQNVRIGSNTYIQLAECAAIPAKLDDEHVKKIEAIIEKNVSATVSVQLKNFWPYGWTLSFILAESHCVISSWHLQKNIFIDIFCCTNIQSEQFKADLCELFQGVIYKTEVSDRYSI